MAASQLAGILSNSEVGAVHTILASKPGDLYYFLCRPILLKLLQSVRCFQCVYFGLIIPQIANGFFSNTYHHEYKNYTCTLHDRLQYLSFVCPGDECDEFSTIRASKHSKLKTSSVAYHVEYGRIFHRGDVDVCKQVRF